MTYETHDDDDKKIVAYSSPKFLENPDVRWANKHSTCFIDGLGNFTRKMHLLLLVERSREPVEALVKAVARCSAAGLDVPLAVAQAVEPELVRHFCR